MPELHNMIKNTDFAGVGDEDVLRNYVDVVYMSSVSDAPPEIKKLFRDKKLTYTMVPVTRFNQVLSRIDLVGTVIIDAKSVEVSHQPKLAYMIESLEMRNIGIILLNKRLSLPVKSFSLAAPQVKSFYLTTSMESVSTDELWARISVNLAYRRKSNSMVVKPAGIPWNAEPRSYNNNLAEQLRIAGALVDNLAEQLRLAGLVQHDFLPAQLPNTPEVQWAATFLPAEWVSGDIYDVVRIDEQHVGFYVADAVGHAMPAALLTIFIKQAMALRETVANNYRIFSPSEVMKNLNMRLAGQKLSGYQFATCCYCLLNIKTLQLTYVRAGHPYPVLIRGTEQPQQLEVRGSLLGIFEHADYIQQTIQLQRGDKVLLYSDGAEQFIGSFDALAGFKFSDEFCQIKDLPVIEMMDRLHLQVKNARIPSAEIDDITAVGLEIL